MKRAQMVVEYAILSALAIAIIAIVITAFNLADFGVATTFGFKVRSGTVVVPPMTP